MTPVEAIRYIRRNDCDFLTPDTIQAYTGCSIPEAREALASEMGTDWLARQDAAT